MATGSILRFHSEKNTLDPAGDNSVGPNFFLHDDFSRLFGSLEHLFIMFFVFVVFIEFIELPMIGWDARMLGSQEAADSP